MANGPLQALIFDVGGTLADIKSAHMQPDLSHVTLTELCGWQNSLQC